MPGSSASEKPEILHWLIVLLSEPAPVVPLMVITLADGPASRDCRIRCVKVLLPEFRQSSIVPAPESISSCPVPTPRGRPSIIILYVLSSTKRVEAALFVNFNPVAPVAG